MADADALVQTWQDQIAEYKKNTAGEQEQADAGDAAADESDDADAKAGDAA